MVHNWLTKFRMIDLKLIAMLNCDIWPNLLEIMIKIVFLIQAKQVRPSIIFFDELDGLAPVRSTKQDQIHASIVCTLLALMDGLDNRGDIVVIGMIFI